jgi:hypothetical protein
MYRTRTFLLGIFLLGMAVGLLLIVPIAYTQQKTDTPTVDSDQISISCGRRTATMYVTKYKEQEPTVSLAAR